MHVVLCILLLLFPLRENQPYVQHLGVCTDMDLSLLPVQLSVNIYMGNIKYLRCPSYTYFLSHLLKYIYVDSKLIITFTLAPND